MVPPARPAPWPCFLRLPDPFLGAPRPFPGSPPTFPARALGETFRGLQQTVRLLGASDVGRVGGGRAGTGRGLGRLRTPRPPTPAPGTQRGRQRVAFTDGQEDHYGQMGQARPCLQSSGNKIQVLLRPTRPCAASPGPTLHPHPLSGSLPLPGPHGPPRRSSNTPGPVLPRGLCTCCSLCPQTLGPLRSLGLNVASSQRPSLPSRPSQEGQGWAGPAGRRRGTGTRGTEGATAEVLPSDHNLRLSRVSVTAPDPAQPFTTRKTPPQSSTHWVSHKDPACVCVGGSVIHAPPFYRWGTRGGTQG